MIVVYDYSAQQMHRELKDPNSLGNPSSLLLTKGEKFLIVCEQYGITVVDIDEAQIVNPTVNNKDFYKILKRTVPGENETGSLASLSLTGQVKIFSEEEDSD